MNIYMITNLLTGLSYIGKDVSDNEWYMGSGLLLWNSYRKHFQNENLVSSRRSDHRWVYNKNKELGYYKKTILDTCDDRDELCDLEKYYISKFNTIRPNGYNIADGGEGGNLTAGFTEDERSVLSHKISVATKKAMARREVREKFMDAISSRGDEWRQKLSEANVGKKCAPMPEHVKQMLREINMGNKYGLGNKSRTGMHNSEEMNRHISEGLKRVPHDAEWNKKVSDALRGRPKSEEHKQHLRKPKPKYVWLKQDGTTVIMDSSNGSRHEGWTRLNKVDSDQVD